MVVNALPLEQDSSAIVQTASRETAVKHQVSSVDYKNRLTPHIFLRSCNALSTESVSRMVATACRWAVRSSASVPLHLPVFAVKLV